MTNAEAAYILDNLAWLGTRDEQDKIEAAIRIAVKELRSGGEKGTSDLISRQAAIDAIKRAIWDKYTAKDAIDAVCNVPSAQPEIIRCKDCKYYEWMSNRVPEEQTWYCHNWSAETGNNDYCSYAERRTDG